MCEITFASFVPSWAQGGFEFRGLQANQVFKFICRTMPRSVTRGGKEGLKNGKVSVT